MNATDFNLLGFFAIVTSKRQLSDCLITQLQRKALIFSDFLQLDAVTKQVRRGTTPAKRACDFCSGL